MADVDPQELAKLNEDLEFYRALHDCHDQVVDVLRAIAELEHPDA